MPAGKETTTVMTLLGDAQPLTVHEDKNDENEVEVNYDPDSPDEVEESALRAGTMAGQHASRKLSRKHQSSIKNRANDSPCSRAIVAS